MGERGRDMARRSEDEAEADFQRRVDELEREAAPAARPGTVPPRPSQRDELGPAIRVTRHGPTHTWPSRLSRGLLAFLMWVGRR